jgi:hypothetical protein
MTGTLGRLISEGYTVTVYCDDCQHSAELNLPKLAARHGNEARLIGSSTRGPATLAGRALVCSRCKARNSSLRISPGGLPSGAISR